MANVDQLSLTLSGANLISSGYDTVTGNISITGLASLDTYETVLKTITFSSSSDTPELHGTNGQRVLEVSVFDNFGLFASSNVSWTISGVNDLPTFSSLAGGRVGFTESIGQVIIDTDLGISDADHSVLERAFVLLNQATNSESLNVTTSSTNLISSYANGNLIIEGIDTLENYQTVLRSLAYANSSKNPSQFGTVMSRELNYFLYDGVGLSDNVAVAINIIEGIDAPTLILSTSLVSATEGLSVTLDDQLVVTDVDSPNLSAAKVSVTGNFIAGDTLSVTTVAGLTASFNGSTGMLDIAGSATLAQYQSVLRTVTYSFSGNNPNNYQSQLARKITFGVNDGALWSPWKHLMVNVANINDPPLLSLSSSHLNFLENTPIAESLLSSVNIMDPDDLELKGANLLFTGHLRNGDLIALTAGGSNIDVGSFNSADGSLSISGKDSLRAYQETLHSLTFFQSSENPDANGAFTERSLKVTIYDASGANNTATVDWSVTGNNDLPQFSFLGGDTLGFSENVISLALDPDLVILDLDHDVLQSANAVLSNPQSSESLSVQTTGTSLIASYSNGLLQISGNASLQIYQSVLRTLSYSNSSQNPSQFGSIIQREVNYVLNDGLGLSSNVSLLISIIEGADAPILTQSQTNVVYTEGDQLVLDASLLLSDIDSTTLTSAKASITTNLQDVDLLDLPVSSGLQWSYSASTGTLEISGTASLATYQQALRSMTFSINSDNPTQNANPTKEVALRVFDGLLWSTWKTYVIQVNGVNSAPVLENITSLSSYTEQQEAQLTLSLSSVNDPPVLSGFSGSGLYIEDASAVYIDNSLSLSDVDSTHLTEAVAYISSKLHLGDALSIKSLPSGMTTSYDANLGVLSLTGNLTLSEYERALESLIYQSSSQNPSESSSSRSVQLAVFDGASWSRISESTLNVLGVNDVPRVSGFEIVTFTEGGGAVSILASITVNDDDSQRLSQANLSYSPSLPEDSWTITSRFGIQVTQGNGSVQLKGLASLAEYAKLLQNISFTNSGDNPDDYGMRKSMSLVLTLIDEDQVESSYSSTLNLVDVNDPPVIRALQPLQVAVGIGETFFWNYEVIDVDDKILLQRAINLPKWASLYDDENLLKGFVDDATAKTYAIDLRVLDPGGLSDRKIIEVLVQPNTSEGGLLTLRVKDESGLPVPGAKVHLFGAGLSLITPSNGELKIRLPTKASRMQRLNIQAEGKIPYDAERDFSTQTLDVVLLKGQVKVHGTVTSGGVPLIGAKITALDLNKTTYISTSLSGGNYELFVQPVSSLQTWSIAAGKDGYRSASSFFTLTPQDQNKKMDFVFELSQESLLGYEVYKSTDFKTNRTYRVYFHAEPDFFPGDELNATVTHSLGLISPIAYDDRNAGLYLDYTLSPLEVKDVTFSFSAQPTGGTNVSVPVSFLIDEGNDETEAKTQQMVSVARGAVASLSREPIVDRSGNALLDRSGFELHPFGVSDNVEFIRFERSKKILGSTSGITTNGAIYTIDAFRTLTSNGVTVTEKLTNDHINEIFLTFSYDPTQWTPYLDRIYYSEDEGVNWILFGDAGISYVDADLQTVTIRSNHLSFWVLGSQGGGLIGRAGGGDAGGGCMLK